MVAVQSTKTQNKTIIFLHTHKTAGSSFSAIIERQFPASAVFPGSLSVHPNWHTLRILLGKRYTSQQIMAEFKQLSDRKKQNIRYLHHHIPFGIHRQLPQSSMYVTMFREPLDRIISLYYYLKRITHIKTLHDSVKSLSLEDFVINGIDDIKIPYGNNAQAYRVSGLSKDTPPSNDVLKLAKENLHNYFLTFGLSERFNESLLLLGNKMGWNRQELLYFKRQVNTNKPTHDTIPNNIRRLIIKHNELDIEFYEYVRDLFEMEISMQGTQFRRDAELFESQLATYRTKPTVAAYAFILKRAINVNIWLRSTLNRL